MNLVSRVGVAMLLVTVVTLAFGQVQPKPGEREPAATSSVSVIDLLPPERRKALRTDEMPAEQRAALESLIVDLTRSTAGSRSAAAYLRRKRYELVAVSAPIRTKIREFGVERECIVISDGLSKWVIEAPLMWTEVAGSFWAKTSPINGADKIIDSRGEEHDLMLSESKELR